MVSVADNVTGTVVQLLKERGMWDNTLMVVSADNGGEFCAGSNYPLKGTKKLSLREKFDHLPSLMVVYYLTP